MKRTLYLLMLCLMVLLCACANLAQADQYRSRVYLDLDQDVTENVSLSVSELEQKINTFQDDYTRGNAEQFLAKHYSQQKDYPKAIEHLENALARPGAADNTRRDMLLQLGRLYLLQKDYTKATDALQRSLSIPGPNSSDTYVLLAQLHYKNKKYVESAASLDKALALDSNPSTDLLQSALGLFYSIGNYEKAAKMVQLLLERDLNNADLWQQWISIYLKAGKHKQALDVMALAWEKGIPFRQQDVLLLMDLYAINKIPGRGARVLEEGLASGRVPSDPVLNERLFKLWLQAGDRDKAEQALEKVAQRGGDRELQLHLAQLYSEKEQWQKMQAMVLKACATPLPDNLVSRANLLLGISQLKLGDAETARRSFINATFFGGEMERANQWLNYMQAEPATEREKIGIAGPCYSPNSRSIFTESLPDQRGQTRLEEKPESNDAKNQSSLTPLPLTAQDLATKKGNPAAKVELKTVASQKLYLGSFTFSAKEFESKVLSTAVRLGMAITKNGGTISGPLHFIFPEPPASADSIKVKFGFPVSGNPKADSGFKLVNDKSFKCVWRSYRGPKEGIVDAFAQLYLDAQVQGYTFTGESRQVMGNDNSPTSSVISMELQVGVK